MLGEILSAYEFMDHRSMESVENNLGLTNPLNSCSFYILIETSGSHGPHDEEKLNLFLSKVMENGTVIDGTIATEPSKIKVHKLACLECYHFLCFHWKYSDA